MKVKKCEITYLFIFSFKDKIVKEQYNTFVASHNCLILLHGRNNSTSCFRWKLNNKDLKGYLSQDRYLNLLET